MECDVKKPVIDFVIVQNYFVLLMSKNFEVLSITYEVVQNVYTH